MARNSALLRPSSPMERPRFQLEAGEADLGASIIEERARSQRPLVILLLSCIGLTALMAVAALATLVPWWAPAVALLATTAVVVGLRLTRESRQGALRENREERQAASAMNVEQTREGAADEESAASATTAHSAPARAEMGAQERYDAFLRDVIGQPARAEREFFRYGALSSSSAPLEDAYLEDLEALDEAGIDTRGSAGRTIAQGLTLDQILERRRA